MVSSLDRYFRALLLGTERIWERCQENGSFPVAESSDPLLGGER